jgi:hypothetical protein
MSQRLISLNDDLKQLRDEGYDVEERGGYLILRQIPYLDGNRQVHRDGVLVSKLELNNDRTQKPQDHTVRFAGVTPSNEQGAALDMINSNQAETLTQDVVVQFSFSRKPAEGYRDYHHKMTTYVHLLGGPVQAVQPEDTPTARVYPLVTDDESGSVFKYVDTASSRADIEPVTRKLELARVAIVGLGGSGSYVLDLVAKTPVVEIHLFDGDAFLQHNAFRSPGAPSGEELERRYSKVDWFEKQYSAMRNGIVAHSYYLTEANVHELEQMQFVFLAMDNGEVKQVLIKKLEEYGIPFTDVGMGMYVADGSLAGQVRATTSTQELRSHVWEGHRIPFGAGAPNEYSTNIQIADLNALAAVMAVVKWKKLFGFYVDLGREHFAAYTVATNVLVNEDKV